MPRYSTTTSIFMLSTIALLALSLAACGEDEGPAGDPPADDPGKPVGIRLFQNLEGLSGDLNVVFRGQGDNNIAHDGIAAGQATEYLAIPPGIYTVIFFDAGTNQPLADLTIDAFNVEATTTRTLILSNDERGQARAHIIPDELTAPPENSARLRFLNQAKAPGVDIYNKADGIRHATAIKYGQNTTYFDLPGAPYDFDVFAENTVTDPLLTLNQLPLLPAHVYSVILTGSAEDGTLSVVQLIDTTF